MINKRGFTLMELLVYMAVVGIVVVIAGQVYSDSTKMRLRSQNMIKATLSANDLGAVLSDDIAQMGAKSSLEETVPYGSDAFLEQHGHVYMDPNNADESLKDSSSFVLSSAGDDLKFRRIRYNGASHYTVEEVRWYLEGTTLKRSCWTVAKETELTLSDSDPCSATTAENAITVDMAQGVSAFNVIAGKPKVNEADIQVFPATGDEFMLVPRFGESHYNLLNVENEGETVKLSGFATNFDKEQNKLSDNADSPDDVERNQLFAAEYESGVTFQAVSWKNFCSKETNNFDLQPGTVYEISFNLSPSFSGNMMSMFTPGRDYLSVGFRNRGGVRSTSLDDFLFYPPTSTSGEAGKRTMRFSVKETVAKQCLVFSFVTYSPVAAEGSMTLSALKLKKVATANYDFIAWNTEAAANIVEKKNVKAFKVSLHMKKNGEEGVVEHVILTASNGPRD